jgi:hypothetical protein
MKQPIETVPFFEERCGGKVILQTAEMDSLIKETSGIYLDRIFLL